MYHAGKTKKTGYYKELKDNSEKIIQKQGVCSLLLLYLLITRFKDCFEH